MAFKSFSEYVSDVATGCHDVILFLDNYSDTIYADLASSSLKGSPLLGAEDMAKLATLRVERLLSAIDYPQSCALAAAVTSGNSVGLDKQFMLLRRHIGDDNKFSEIAAVCEKSFFDCQLPSSSVPLNIDVLREELISVAKSYAEKIGCAVREGIKDWSKTTIRVEAIKPASGLICEEFRVSIGEAYSISFTINDSMSVYDTEFSSEAQFLTENFDNFVKGLRNDKRDKSFGVFYLCQPRSMRQIMEQKRRDISLGIKAFLPKFSQLSQSPQPQDGFDVWRLRMEMNNLDRLGDGGLWETKDQAMLRSVDLLGE